MESGQIGIQDILIKGLGEEIAIKAKEYLKKNHIEESETEVNIEIIENNDPYKIKVITTINRRRGEAKRKARIEMEKYKNTGGLI